MVVYSGFDDPRFAGNEGELWYPVYLRTFFPSFLEKKPCNLYDDCKYCSDNKKCIDGDLCE